MSSNALNLGVLVIQGEKDKVEKLDGGTTNGPCDEEGFPGIDLNGDGDFDDTDEVPANDTNDDGTANQENVVHANCPDTGEGVVTFTTDANSDDIFDEDDEVLVVNNPVSVRVPGGLIQFEDDEVLVVNNCLLYTSDAADE